MEKTSSKAGKLAAVLTFACVLGAGAQSFTKPQATSASLDQTVKDKAAAVFGPIIENDDKKAKLAYGRAARFLPEILQFAFDLRFRNYEHAQAVLEKSTLVAEEKAFWGKVVAKKPGSLSRVVCDEISKAPPAVTAKREISSIEREWADYFADVVAKQTAETKHTKMPQELNTVLGQIKCDEAHPWLSRTCEALGEELGNQVLDEKFFDKLHNWKRRDTRFVSDTYRNISKLATYDRYVSVAHILNLWRALNAMPDDFKRRHYARRFTSIARDMRTETIDDRVVGDMILGDNADLEVAQKLQAFLANNPMVAIVTRIDHDLASCDLKKDH